MAITVTATPITGSQYTSEDRFYVDINGLDMSGVNMVTHGIEVVSGSEVTHGGGASSSDFLHYKNADIDADEDGVIDYSRIQMFVNQTEKGDSVIKFRVSVLLQSEIDAYTEEVTAWDDAKSAALALDQTYEVEPPTAPEPTIYTTSGSVTLSWSDPESV